MKMLLGVCLLLTSVTLRGADAKEKNIRKAEDVIVSGPVAGEGNKIRLFILSGQSNMAGLKHWESYVPKIQAAFPDDSLIFVKNSQSGQPIRRWARDWKPVGDWTGRNARDKPGNNDLYVKLFDMVKEAQPSLPVDTVAFVWMQGEADAKAGQSENYEAALKGLIQQVRTDTGHPDAVAVVGRISDHQTGDEHWDRVRSVQVKVCEQDGRAAWVDTDDLNGKKDGLHYDANGYQVLGERFAEATLKLLK